MPGHVAASRPKPQAPIIVILNEPSPRFDGFDFARFHDAPRGDGIVIHPGKRTEAPSFWIGPRTQATGTTPAPLQA